MLTEEDAARFPVSLIERVAELWTKRQEGSNAWNNYFYRPIGCDPLPAPAVHGPNRGFDLLSSEENDVFARFAKDMGYFHPDVEIPELYIPQRKVLDDWRKLPDSQRPKDFPFLRRHDCKWACYGCGEYYEAEKETCDNCLASGIPGDKCRRDTLTVAVNPETWELLFVRPIIDRMDDANEFFRFLIEAVTNGSASTGKSANVFIAARYRMNRDPQGDVLTHDVVFENFGISKTQLTRAVKENQLSFSKDPRRANRNIYPLEEIKRLRHVLITKGQKLGT